MHCSLDQSYKELKNQENYAFIVHQLSMVPYTQNLKNAMSSRSSWATEIVLKHQNSLHLLQNKLQKSVTPQ